MQNNVAAALECTLVAIARAGAIEPLVALLRSGTAGVQESAAGALRNLAIHDDNKVAIARAGYAL